MRRVKSIIIYVRESFSRKFHLVPNTFFIVGGEGLIIYFMSHI